MKKHLFTIAAVAFALCACQKAETGTNEVTPGVNEEVGAPQQILIGTNLKSSELVTKASVDYWDGQTVYVIGYDNAKISKAKGYVDSDADKEVFIMPNVNATVTPVNTDDGENPKGTLNFGDSKFYYNENVDSYDFVGYYLGDVNESTITKADNGCLFVNFNINGQNDVLAAITDIDNDRRFEQLENGNWSAVSTKYVYSAFASRKGVTPTLIFNHMLTKFSFKVTYGSNEGAEDFKLKKISLGTFTEGAITFNALDRTAPSVEGSGNEKTVALEIDPESEQTSLVTFAQNDKGPKEAGELMVFPGEDEYKMTLVYSQGDSGDYPYNTSIKFTEVKWKQTEDGEYLVPKDVRTANKFLSGKHYVVNVKVYGLEKIEVNVELVPWDEVGSVKIDPDAEKEGEEGTIEEVEVPTA